eukprot:4056613-Amphidinium_carterae.1
MAIGQRSKGPTLVMKHPSVSLTGPTMMDQVVWNQTQAASAQSVQNCSGANLNLWRCLGP